MDSQCVLVVDDDKEIREAIEIYLRNEGLHVLHAKDGLEAMELLRCHTVHLIVLDVMMPKLDGIAATFKIREAQNIPIILLSAKSEDADKVLGLQIGADDYMTKPFNPLELIARVKAQLRRYMSLGTFESEDKERGDKVVQLHGITFDPVARQVTVNGEPVHFTPMEYKIFALLATNAGRVFSIREIYERVWQEPYYNADNTVAVHVRKIREKIEIDPKNPRHLKVVWGVGYKMEK
ncbi:response regulator transcription factor [Alicyclobacillus acidiphilus]|uniref:response regulator transcription factor n=1 Tax=Alicyclobacillus acidiphilus TaxID=182455 RepID=UPI00083048C2|nr:response regulator transcription factor [Alicyclobacillus acidiphilus]